MSYNLDKGAERIIADLHELAELTSDENGAQRIAWTPLWETTRAWFKEKAVALGAAVSRDSAGNVWTKIEGESDDAIIIGSHLDSVPNGGWLDGALGVISGLEALRRYTADGVKPKKTIYVVDWADEEGARYGHSCLGSSAASGTLNLSEFIGRTDTKGVLFENAVENHGLVAEKLLDANKELKAKLNKLKAYLEFHIEQGPVLEQTGKDASSVYGAAGVERHYIDFTGQSAHAGSFPIKMRQDAFLAAATAALEFRELALKYDAVCTVGEVSVGPDVVTIVPGKCTISLDMRTINKENLKKMFVEAHEIVNLAAKKFKCEANWRKIYSIEPQLFDENLVELCKEAVKEETGEPTNMYSGPLHDAVEMAKLIPTVMMFVMLKDGLSHTKEEDTPEDKLRVGIRAFLRLIDKVVNS
jgi:hydantoinase/carbamoylase family amidase